MSERKFVPCGRLFNNQLFTADTCKYGRLCDHCRHIATLERIMDEAGIAVMDDGEWLFGDPIPRADASTQSVD